MLSVQHHRPQKDSEDEDAEPHTYDLVQVHDFQGQAPPLTVPEVSRARDQEAPWSSSNVAQ